MLKVNVVDLRIKWSDAKRVSTKRHNEGMLAGNNSSGLIGSRGNAGKIFSVDELLHALIWNDEI